MTKQTTKRVALIIGGTGGIGKSVVEKLAKEGFAVAIHYASNQGKANDLVKAIINQDGEAISVGGDSSNEEAMKEVFHSVEEHFGGIDVVVNTAGIMLLSPIASLELTDLDKIYQTNIRGTFIVSKYAAQNIRSGGALINFSTSVTKTQFPTYGAYVASKAAVESMTLILARELRGKDITVNAVAPGPTATPLFLDGKTEEAIQQLAQATPLERLGQPEDSAEIVAFLAGPARWINGQVLFTNGGLA
ncbi:SDR family oxidoreductase [Carnobacterium gallinarum]|uniref:SDR family oxidoreductase n=1 Tax=Carnobacterium gallinarum TaxID=2749 RepID=UPI00055100BE|nr:SDR family oxidoreductase [Carnobacterium gallinarum]